MSWIKTAYVGQKVVCLNKGIHQPWANPCIVGEVYTIATIEPWTDWDGYEDMVIYLKEVLCPLGFTGWSHRLFKPAPSTEAGMAILRSLLNPVNHRQLEDA